MSEDFFSISEINRFIKDVIDSGFPQPLWVCGEIQGYNRNKHKSHVYFELVEKDPESKNILAKINAVIFANNKSYINGVLKKAENAFELKDDIEVKFQCKVNFYEPYGTMSLIIEDIDPSYTLGKLAQEKQKLIAKLKKKGVLDKNKELELPLVPLNIGLITAENSAAYNDFISELSKSGYGFQVYLQNALMQGSGAEPDISKAIAKLNKKKDLDVIVITRGGGSLADLACFDSEMIAEAVAKSDLPILSGIGHEINLSVTDMAAHTFAKTPTAIAQFIVNQVQLYVERMEALTEQILESVEELVEQEKQTLKDMALVIQNQTMDYLKSHHERIIRMQEVVRQRPAMMLKENKRIVLDQKDDLIKSVQNRIQSNNQQIKNFEKIVEAYHPQKTLRRGFSITRTSDGKSIRQPKDVKAKDVLITELAEGHVYSIVKE